MVQKAARVSLGMVFPLVKSRVDESSIYQFFTFGFTNCQERGFDSP